MGHPNFSQEQNGQQEKQDNHFAEGTFAAALGSGASAWVSLGVTGCDRADCCFCAPALTETLFSSSPASLYKNKKMISTYYSNQSQ